MKVKIQGKGGPGGGGAGRWTPARPAGVWAGGGERGIPDEEPAAGRGLRRARAGRGAAARAGRVLAGRVATFPSLAFPSPPLHSRPDPSAVLLSRWLQPGLRLQPDSHAAS